MCIDATTLVPRPETETVVETALAAVDADGLRARALRIADLGTGSGALLLALADRIAQRLRHRHRYRASERCGWRARNAQRLGSTRAAFVACDMAAALGGPFDLIVSNPPYIASADIGALAPEVRDFDRASALDGGHDGLDCYRAIAADGAGAVATGRLSCRRIWRPARRRPSPPCSRPRGLRRSPPRADLSGSAASAHCEKVREKPAMSMRHWSSAKKRQKSTWNIGRNRLALPLRNRPEMNSAAPPTNALRGRPSERLAAQAR